MGEIVFDLIKKKETMEEKTTTQTAQQTDTASTMDQVDKALMHHVKAPVFIMFAEYLGLVSKLLPWAEEWCDGKQLKDYQIKTVETDAISLFNVAKKQYSIDQIVEWFDCFWDVILKDYNDKVVELERKNAKADIDEDDD